jgi:protein gp37
MSKIEWTGKTWNPIVGCTKVSAGCKNCYAEVMHGRLTAMGQPKYADPFRTVRTWPAHLDIPLRRKKPTDYFVNSMSDLFHKDVPNEYIAAVFGVMAACPQHTFQVLTKRAERLEWFGWLREGAWAPGSIFTSAAWEMGDGSDADVDRLFDTMCNRSGHQNGLPPWPLPNVWLGVSVENADHLDRIDHLRRTPAAVRFLSLEPLLGPLQDLDLDGIHWVIVGGESGPGARPCDVSWIRDIVRQCRVAGVPCFVKQLGANPYQFRRPSGAPDDGGDMAPLHLKHHKGGDPSEWPEDLRVREMPA